MKSKRAKLILPWAVSIALLAAAGRATAADEGKDPYFEKRREMVRTQIERRGVRDKRVLEVMRKVPRHLFVPGALRRKAYNDHPLPIGEGQTISQPYIVALMTELLNVGPEDRVLEVGTGSGYQAAVLAELAGEVVTVEIFTSLADSARKRLKKEGYGNVTVVQGDGYFGFEKRAPFDGIIVTCAAPHIPPTLIEQLKAGGRMIIPVGAPFMTQNLMLVSKENDGTVTTRSVLPVIFVPLLGH
ncbi:MAG: protein-L-isoaspartate(D-aspartate) O-methyltransferase [Deltaproteobacteria bacterium]|nr:protein-L-isoaspartate(D-aspartate) O-methyltransferase [Deltaproteobacteria bacterium]NIS76056.1 protein-L-isoaspartate(D-aspartate) O-methyltransferase [Deltaproteobacteria bacterium]